MAWNLCVDFAKAIRNNRLPCFWLLNTDALKVQKQTNRVGQYLYWKICTNFLVATTKIWYKHKPEPVTEGPGFNILWDLPYILTEPFKPTVLISCSKTESITLAT